MNQSTRQTASTTRTALTALPVNALMAPKPKPKLPSPRATRAQPARWLQGSRDALGLYILRPESFPSTAVIAHTPSFVVVNDLYPKSSVHVLLLPRSQAHTHQHPFQAFRDAAFRASVQSEIESVKGLVARELQRRFGAESRAEAARQAVLDGDGNGDGEGELPEGRDWRAEVISGVHSRPSMNHLHVHVLSRDMHSPALKHRKHYNSFNTPFLIDVADFPLGEDDPRLDPGGEGYLQRDLTCWRCGRGFGNRFKALKDHLEEEFETWRRE